MLPSIAAASSSGASRQPEPPVPPRALLSKLKKHSEALKLPDLTSPRDRSRSGWDAAAREVKKRFVSPRLQAEAREEASIVGYVSAVMSNADSPDVQVESFVALCTIVARGATQARLIVKTGGLECILFAMRSQLEFADIQQRGATALSQIASADLASRHRVVRSTGVQALVDAAERHLALPSVQERCCTAFVAIADGGDDECRHALVDHRVVPAVIRGMQKHTQRANLQARACAVIAAVAVGDGDCRRALLEGFGVVAVCDAMHAHKGNLDVEQPGCVVLLHLSSILPTEPATTAGDLRAACVRSIVNSAGLQRLVSAVRWHPTIASLTQIIAGAIANIAATADVDDREQILSSNAIAALIAALERHVRKPSVAESGVAALCNAMVGGEEYVDDVIRYGGLRFIRNAMASSRHHESILLSSCLCVLNAARISLDAKDAILTSKVVKGVVIAMHDHPQNAPLVEAACSALANIAAGIDIEHDEELAMTDESLPAGEEAGSARIPFAGAASKPPVASSNRPGTSASLSRSRPSTRGGQADSAAIVAAEELHQVRVALLDLGAAPTIVTALSQHKSSDAIIEEGVIAIRNLAAGDSHECRDALLGCECAQAVSYSMRAHMDNLSICLQGCLAIRNLGCGDAKQLFCLIDAGGVSAVIEALVKHAADPAVAQAACAALRNIAVDSWGGSMSRFSSPACSVGAILDADGPAAIVEAMQACADSMPVQVHGCGALRNLACGTRDDPHSRARALKAIEKANGVDVVINAIRTHPDNLMLSAQACAALRNISMTPELRGSVVARGGVEVAASVLQATLDLTHSAACEQAVACLANLVNSPPRRFGEESESAHRQYVQDAHRAASNAVNAGAVKLVAAVLASRTHSGQIIANVSSCLNALLQSAMGQGEEATTKMVEDILEHEGVLDELAHGCVAFPEFPFVLEHACSCLCHMLDAAPNLQAPLRGAIAMFSTKDDMLSAIHRAEEAEMLRLVPRLDELVALMTGDLNKPARRVVKHKRGSMSVLEKKRDADETIRHSVAKKRGSV